MRSSKELCIIAAAAAIGLAGCGGGSGAKDASGPPGGPPAAVDAGGSGPGSQLQAKYPGATALMRGVSGLRSLMKSGVHPLLPHQAARLEALLKPLPDQPTLSQENATKLASAINGNLTPDQQDEIGLLHQERRGGRGGPGGGPGGGGPGAGPGGGRGRGPGGGGFGGPGGGRHHGGASGGAGGGNAAAGGGSQGQPRWLPENMPSDFNPFHEGRGNQMLLSLLQDLHTSAQG